MLKIFENYKLGATQLLNENGHLIGQWHWDIFDQDWAYEKAKEMRQEVLKYRKEYSEFGYTKGVRRGMDQ